MITTMNGNKFRDDHSLSLDGSNDYLAFGDITALDGLNEMTISMWVKYKDTNNQIFISKGDYNTSGSSFYFNISPTTDNGRLRLSVGNADSDSGGFWYRNSMSDASLTGRLNINEWNHLAVTYSVPDETVYFYINGFEYLEGSGAGDSTFIAIPNTSHELKIGTDSSENSFFYGNISDTAIYDTKLSHSQIKMIYNGREPYNHKEGPLSKNLVCWWRMGDGALDSYPLVTDSSATTSLGADIITNGTFDSNVTGWSDYSSGTVSHETTITHSGAGSLKCTFDGTNYWGGMQTSDIGSVQANTLYVVEAYIYIPSGFDGGNCRLTDGASFSGATPEEDLSADSSITNEWQLSKTVFRTGPTDTAGKLYIRTASNPSDTKYIFVDSVTMRPVTGGNPGHTYNMTSGDIVGDTP